MASVINTKEKFAEEPDLKYDKRDTSFIQKNLKLISAYEKKPIKATKVLVNKSVDIENAPKPQKLKRFSKDYGKESMLNILEKQAQEIDILTMKLTKNLSKMNRVDSDLVAQTD